MNDADASSSHTVTFRVNDSTLPEASRNIRVEVHTSPENIEFFASQGYLRIKDIVPPELIARFRTALDRIAAQERNRVDSEVLKGNAHYLRNLMDKDPIFIELMRASKPLSIARALLGPQVWFDVEARIVAAGVPAQKVNWHIHHRVLLNPLPAFFAYPHAVHGLLYLDDVGDAEGPICLLPGSHRRPDLEIAAGDCEDKPGQVILPVQTGDCLLIHPNLWHRTEPTSAKARARRLLLFGYTPSWIKGDVSRGVKVAADHTEALRRGEDREARELLGEFFW